ncbi:MULTISPECIES: hypothetical protein [Bradyrhizobium]|uniref:Uncharacterized protein n=1 Tax=Bradyrhizobium neotropicale TaxID=1497615 RepID=A0A176Z844_9BRAD|nr:MULTISPECIES: hypothetical protein [Bradyrhizobium]OAF16881.1 hypothetical protein AXW67_11225 [Bradyrhizobium neotropicale]
MRKIILVAAMVLASASAQAAGTRSLTLASAETPAATNATPAAAPAETPKYVDRPAAVPTTPAAATTTPATNCAPSNDAAKPAPKTTAKADKPRRHRGWTEGRIIGELHRHGIYW